MLDPDFDWLTLSDVGQPAYFEWAAGGRKWALEDAGGVAAPGTTPTAVDQFGADIGCQYISQIIPLVYSTATWHMPLFDGIAVSAQLRAAVDAVMAAAPDTEYVTFAPSATSLVHNALNACGNRDTAIYPGMTPDSDSPPPSWTQVVGRLETVTDQPQRFEIDGTPVDIAVSYNSTDWYVGDSWGPTTADGGTDGGLGPDSAWGQLGQISGRPAFLLRPTALTWPGSDAANTANRIFWLPDDVVGDVDRTVAGQWGHYEGGGFVDVQGWILHSAFVPRTPGAFTIGDPVGGRLRERNRIAGSQLDAMGAVDGNAYDGTTTGVGSSSADDGVGGVVR